MKYHSQTITTEFTIHANTYFAQTYMRTINKYSKPGYAVDVWATNKSFGLGDFMGYDLPTGKRCSTSKTYKRSILMEMEKYNNCIKCYRTRKY
jgi:cell division protein FtsI/penicillin-binding protein 2